MSKCVCTRTVASLTMALSILAFNVGCDSFLTKALDPSAVVYQDVSPVVGVAAPVAGTLTITSVTLDGQTQPTVCPGSQVTVEVTVDVGTGITWGSTIVSIDGNDTCEDHANLGEGVGQVVSFNIAAPATQGGPLPVVVTAFSDDACTNDASAPDTSTGLTTADDNPLTIDACPPATTVECDGAGNADELSAWLDSFAASGGCGGVTLSNDFVGLPDDCGAAGSATVTFTATDANGLSTSCTSTFSIPASQRTLYIKHLKGHGPCPPQVYPEMGDDDDDDDDCSNRALKMLLVGDVDFDVTQVDLSTIELRRCDGLGGSVNPCEDGRCGGPGDDDDDDDDDDDADCFDHRIFKYKDRNHPNPGDVGCGEDQLPCACGDDDDDDDDDCSGDDDDDDDCVPCGNHDCIIDLEVKVRLDSMITAGLLQGVSGDVISLYLCGELYNGCKFIAVDCVQLLSPDG